MTGDGPRPDLILTDIEMPRMDGFELTAAIRSDRRLRDTPVVLKGYGAAHGAKFEGWAFLTGTPAEIREVAKRYGIYYKKTVRGDVDHTFLTSVIDPRGFLRALVAGLFAFGGWHMVTYAADETRGPEKTIPRALMLGTAVVVAIWLGVGAWVYWRRRRRLSRRSLP